MPSLHETAIRDIVNRRIREGDPYMPIVMETMGRMNDGLYPAWLLDSVMQRHRNNPFDLYDAYSFLQFYSDMLSGNLYTASIVIGATPVADRRIEENNALLANIQPYYAKFVGGLGDSDGTFGWTRPITLRRHLLNTETDIDEHTEVIVDPMEIPLEVGYTKASRSFLHVRMGAGLARWAYGSSAVVVFVTAPEARRQYEDILDGDLSR